MTTTQTTKRLGRGVYRLHNVALGDFTIRHALNGGEKVVGWHLLGPDGEWWQTFATKREAVEVAAAAS